MANLQRLSLEDLEKVSAAVHIVDPMERTEAFAYLRSLAKHRDAKRQ